MNTVYFAHPVTHYNKDIEIECIDFIAASFSYSENIDGLSLLNPNVEWLERLYNNRKKSGHPAAFDIFLEIVDACDIVIGVAFKDGSIGAGIAKEMQRKLESGGRVYLIMFDKDNKLIVPIFSMDVYNVLSVEETRKRIKENVL